MLALLGAVGMTCDVCGKHLNARRDMQATVWVAPAGFAGHYPQTTREARDYGYVLAVRCMGCAHERLPTADEIFIARRARWRRHNEQET